jgi:flavin-dependent dehydrogenase
MNSSADLDTIVLGGGPAGCAAAIELAMAGMRVALLERALDAQDKVCGDFLSAEALENLIALGVDADELGAVEIERVRLAGALGVASARLPFRARSLTRRVLDDALLDRAAEAGALVLRGHSAEALHRAGEVWNVVIAGPSRVYSLTAPHVVLATGKHDLRGLPRPAGVHQELVGLKMYLRLAEAQAAELEGAIELVLMRGGYGGLSMVERGRANLCFVVPRGELGGVGRGWSALAEVLSRNRHMRERLEGAEPLLARPLAISPIPYGMLRREAIAEGMYAIGDQGAVIPSFTGDGLAIALHSGRLAARAWLEGETAQEFQAELYTQLRRQMTLATRVSRALVRQPYRGALEIAARVAPRAIPAMAAWTRLEARHQLAPAEAVATRENTCAAA